jgi:hypothetical protein
MEKWLAKEHVCFREISVELRSIALQKIASYDPAQRLKRFGFGMTPAEIGCFLAHKACWEESVAENITMLILESDVAPVTPGALRQLLHGHQPKVRRRR